MSKISSMLDIGKRSMANSQTALQTVSHNIANQGTKGYSRQRVEMQTSEPVGLGKLRIGMGAKSASVTRTNNPFLEKQILGEGSKLGYSQSESDALSRVEQIFNEQINRGLSNFVSDFFNSFRELANNPESLATRTQVREAAAFLTKDFSRISGQLKKIQSELDQQIVSQVQEVNGMAQEIANLNEKIQMVELNGGYANDERDQRDQVLKDLGQKIDMNVSESEDGQLNVTVGGTAVLVSGYSYGQLQAAPSAEMGNKRESNYSIYFTPAEKSAPTDITQRIRGGAIGAAIHVRDGALNDNLHSLDEMAFVLAEKVNEAHRLGYNAKGETGLDFFSPLAQVRDAAEQMDLSAEIHRDLNRISAGARPDAPGDNRIALLISSIQDRRIMGDGESTVNDHYNGIVGKLAVQTKKANSVTEHQKGIVSQLNNVRESISGVSLDEETVKMIEFQKAYQASAKMVQVADELLETVINMV
ncbi:MAG: flagellar hook-associated protein FlgK [Bdellovibrionales bacterium CG10_big_fil_rev_8_21_14_0_10_45_34]|nr:MAG: flagellar hook-associated protein FlgK [Bdellovibrionales bacterium CG10_big_fil_rev_8_21_14_0_10_45_34]